jgi:energy-coupling factor transporter ATP-binding protein EcfA2
MKIILEHVRSFSRRCEVPIRPLTLLVGENSSGKSTFLSVVSCVLNSARFPANPNFNEPPYNLGTFETIATYKGGKYGRDEAFSIGFSDDREGREHGPRTAVATYGSESGNIVLRRLESSSRSGKLDLKLDGLSLEGSVVIQPNRGRSPKHVSFRASLNEAALIAQRPFAIHIIDSIFGARNSRSRQSSKGPDFQSVYQLLDAAEPPYRNSYSFAPIRSKPRRTYDESSEEYSPEGDHIPKLLARLLRQEPSSADSRSVQAALSQFGKESGLFNRITVKKLGQKMTDPFQIQVAVAGPAVNLTDVGYGVSQALPIVVQSVLKTTSRVLLMQQPEVHLHPRAQAALGSFFAGLIEADERLVIMETHSDYLVDRVRQEVASGKLDRNKVQILFFDKPKLETKIYPITLDESGNIESAPETYRSFFLREQLNLFSRTGD